MSRVSWLLGLTLAAAPVFAAEPLAPGDVLEDEPGTTVQVGRDWIGIVPDFDPAIRFAPDELPAEFRRGGLRVLFSGTVGEIPANARLWGTPLALTAIRLAETAEAAAETPEAAPSSRVERLAIVDRAIDFHGGELYRHSAVELDLCSKSGCFHLWVSTDGDAWEHRVSGLVDGRRVEVRATHDAVEVWRDGQAVPGEGEEQRWRDFAMARIYFPFLPYRLNDPGVLKEDLGLVPWEGRKLHRVKVTFESGTSTDSDDEYMYWLDPETGRVELFAYSYRSGDAGLRFRRATGHRRVGGILFFDQENFGVEGEGLVVEMIDPAFVAERMRHVSTVRLENVRVSAADAPPTSRAPPSSRVGTPATPVGVGFGGRHR